jgi:hypothetical protein
MSRERTFYLADRIVQELVKLKIPIRNSRLLRACIINTLTRDAKLLESIDEKIRNKILSSKKAPPEGSPSWQILYEKYFNEEISVRLKK